MPRRLRLPGDAGGGWIPAPGCPPRPARPLGRGTGRHRLPARQARAGAPSPAAALPSGRAGRGPGGGMHVPQAAL